jgi:hemerythrin-like metal-binding protein
MASFNIFPWKSGFEIGIEEIDLQHKKLVSLINQLAAYITQQSVDIEHIQHIVNELIDYTQYHFSFEEQVWEQSGFPITETEEHKAFHQKFIDQVDTLASQLKNDEYLLNHSNTLLNMLLRWLTRHILKSDMLMGRTLIKVRQGLDFDEAKTAAHRELHESELLTDTILSIYEDLSNVAIQAMSLSNRNEDLVNKLNEAKQWEKELSYKFIDNLPGYAILMYDDGEFIRVNKATVELFLSSNMDQMHADTVFPERFRKDLRQYLCQITEDKNVQFESSIKLNHQCVAVSVAASKYTYRERKAYVLVINDISELKAWQIELEAKNKAFVQAEKVAKFGHWTLEHSTGNITWSDGVYKLFQLNPETFKPTYQSFLNLIPQKDRFRVDNTFQQALKNKRSEVVIHEVFTGEHNIIKVAEKGYTEYDDQNVPVRTLGTVVDISELSTANKHLEEYTHKIQNTFIATIKSVSKALEARDPYTAGHQQRVAEIAVMIGVEMGLEHDVIRGIWIGSMVHDIGKLGVPVELLTKPTRLLEMEFQIIKSHPSIGFDIFKGVHFPWPIEKIIVQHHERMDGSGYPEGLKGDEICLEARIVAVADVFEAMSAHRPYRASLGIQPAIEELSKNKGKFYDPWVVDTLLYLIDKETDFHEEFTKLRF